jgi:hypothetical protein
MTRDVPGYPYFEATLWGGRLPVPLEYRGTVIARDFESGRIGGKAIKRHARFDDTRDGRRALQDWTRQYLHDSVEIDYIRDPHRHRVPLGRHVVFRPDFVQQGVIERDLR